jgi:hypothetical protein
VRRNSKFSDTLEYRRRRPLHDVGSCAKVPAIVEEFDMNMSRRHQGDTKNFEELTYSEQAKAINIRVVGLQRCMAAHKRRAAKENRDVNMVSTKCKNQIQRLLSRV